MTWNAFINWVSSWFVHDDKELKQLLAGQQELRGLLQQLLKQGEHIMASLDEVLADVTAETTSLDSIATLIAGLKQQVTDALSGTTLPPAVQSKVDAIFTAAETNKQKIAAALAANVPTP